MKSIIIGLVIVISNTVLAQKPEKVYSITKELREMSWYQDQQKAWESVLEKKPTNGEAWINYYATARAMRNIAPSESRENYRNLCKEVVVKCEKAMPNSFESEYLKYREKGAWNGGAELMKAQKLRPNGPELIEELMIYYELQREQNKHYEYAEKMFNANEMAPGQLNWGYNILAELDENAILFTHGDNDTYAVWIVEAAKKFRRDVTIINTSLMRVDDYRNRLFADLGLPKMEYKISESANHQEYRQAGIDIVKYILKTDRPIYFSNSTIEEFEHEFADKLYLTGLAYKYCKNAFDNLAIIKRNYEKRYLLDYLLQNFSYHIANDQVLQLNGTYLPSMIKLYQHYQESEEIVKKTELEKFLIVLGDQTHQQTEIRELLSSPQKTPSFLSTVLDIKEIEKEMQLISGNKYMQETEVSNGQYQLFLANVLRSRELEIFQKAMYDSTQWVKKFKDSDLRPLQNMQHWHPAYENYPIVNISQEGAKYYCEWLTSQYNSQKKRKYKKVIFRLPSEQEWRLAAGYTNENSLTPFPNDKIRDEEKNCYLANIKTSETTYFEDGGLHTVRVKSYFPNEKGLYCVLGNVAEMTDIKGSAIGGSWTNLFEECTFDKRQMYDGPDPRIGFRVLMEVIEN
ncbi:MAG: formylglycine-generating enzyme family protein [Bacteroidota bacterium]